MANWKELPDGSLEKTSSIESITSYDAMVQDFKNCLKNVELTIDNLNDQIESMQEVNDDNDCTKMFTNLPEQQDTGWVNALDVVEIEEKP